VWLFLWGQKAKWLNWDISGNPKDYYNRQHNFRKDWLINVINELLLAKMIVNPNKYVVKQYA